MTTAQRTADQAEPGNGLRLARLKKAWLPDTPTGLLAAGLALVLPLLSIRVSDSPGWTGRYSLLAVEAAVGLPIALSLLRTARRRPAIAALAFLAVAALSTALSDNLAMSFWGNEYWGTGLLFVAAMVGIWAIGVAGEVRGADSVAGALVVGALLNALVALLQVFLDLSRFGADTYQDQSTGFFGQPAHLGAFLLGGMWLVSNRAVTGRRAMMVGLVLVASGLEVTGERGPLLLSAFVVVGVTLRHRIRAKAMVAALVAIGLLIGALLGSFGSSQRTATDRLGSELNENPRVENYVSAVNAFADRPVLGWGPGRYLAGTAPHKSEALAKANGQSYFLDAHDWPLHWLVTTGVLGFATLALWLTLAARGASGPLAGFALCIAVVQLMQPIDVGATPLAMLALGGAAAIGTARSVVPAVARGILVVAGVSLGALISVGAWRAYEGIRTDPMEVFRAARLLPSWPDRSNNAARASLALETGSTQDRVDAAVHWARATVARDARDPRGWSESGYYLVIANQLDEAKRYFNNALALDPYSTPALTGLGLLEVRRGRFDSAIGYFNRSLAIVPTDTFTLDWMDIAKREAASQQVTSPP